MNNYNQQYKLRFRMIIINTALSILPIMLIGFISYNIYMDNINKVASETINILFNQASGRLEEHFESIDSITKLMFLDNEFQRVLRNDPKLTDRNNYFFIKERFSSLSIVGSTIKDVYLITNAGKQIGSDSAVMNEEISNYLKTSFLPENIGIKFVGMDINNDIFAIRAIRDLETLDFLGTGVIVIDRAKLVNIVQNKNMSDKFSIVMLDSENRPVVTHDFLTETDYQIFNNLKQDEMTAKILSTGDYILSRHKSEKTNWTLIAFASTKLMYEEANVLKYSIFFLTIFVFILVIVLTIFTNIQITKPIKLLADAINKVASGDLKQQVVFKEKNEITAIADNFNNMVAEVKLLTKKIFSTQQRLYEIELEKKQFEISLLQSQINSHFLYNTLNCIRGMSNSGAASQVGEMIQHLVGILRYASELDECVELRQEFDYLSNYINIQKTRLGDQLKFEIDVENSIMHSIVPKMILQPVVENSIMHGFKDKPGSWLIKIKAESIGGILNIKIFDNGVGIKKQKLDAINNALINKTLIFDNVDQKPSIGLSNIQKRITAMFSEDYKIEIKSWENIGTVVVIRIPFKRGGLDV